MAKIKGSVKTGGRKKGTPNKITSDIREKIKTFLESKADDLDDIWESLEAKEKIQMFNHLCRYVVPTMQSTEFKVDSTTESYIQKHLEELSQESS